MSDVEPQVEDQSQDGVRVVVTRYPGEGSVVDASCACFGTPTRAHSDPSCPNLPLNGLHAEVSRAEDEEDALLLIYKRVDDRLRRGDFAAVDRVLAGAWDDLPALYSLALLSISYAAKDELRERVAFHARVRARLLREDRERVDELLAGF